MTLKRLFLFQSISTFFSGASLLCLLLIFFYMFPNLILWDDAVSYGPWLEEGLKFVVVLFLISLIDLKTLTIPFVGLGFGIIESINYARFHSIFSITPILAHVVFGFVMAYFFYLARNKKQLSLRSIWYALALLIPVYLHLLYNIAIKNWFV
jgi:RsiW-degrading membrane proteinase PrsW (M82 family)